MKSRYFVGAALGVVLAPVCAQAAEAGPLDETIVVAATRTEVPLSQVGQSVSVVTREDIERTQATTASEVLSRLPGLQVTNSGGFGQPSSVFIRGADNAQSLVLIDGVRVNDPGDVGGGFDFGALTIAQFDRVEVVRGSSGVLYGSRAIGGVINLVTQRPEEEWHGRASAEYGWRDRRQVSASAAGLVGPVGLTVGGNWLKGDGYSAFNEDRGATEKDGFESKSLNARAQVELTEGLSIDGGTFWTRANYDYDNTGADALNVGFKRDLTGYANIRYAGLDDRLHARVGYGVVDTRRISDARENGTNETNGKTERFEGQLEFTPITFVSVLVGAETEKQNFNGAFTYSGVVSASNDSMSIDSLFANLTLRPVTGLTLNGGLRYDDNSQFGDRTTFAANGVYAFAGDEGPVIRASYGEGFKAPSLYQLFTNIGSQQLDPETSKSWDVGIEQPFAEGHGVLSVNYFDRKAKNQIEYRTIDFYTWEGAYFNISRARAKGLEVAMQVHDWQGFDLNLAYTYLDAKNGTTGYRLARRAKNNMTVSLDKRWDVNEFGGLRLGAELRVGGGRWDDLDNAQWVEGNTVVNLRGSFAVTQNVEVFARMENLFDEHYEVVRTYGTPGRSAYAGVRVKM
ncbi:TonB-dependent receptor plug domain-containing protein [Novosphingobium decolorationis]|uniref:TonB-dependent receptor n=1 Tax=Novosphingobium decolorationis TaxID=2698673 RepID=A0ABX8EBQ8_9SPHN|nr:TonB-dependent receptor [Novosphingobium decolorationis]QVM85595.1 TonB-dependent receptor [Novosphingobium decolorationis]